MGLKEMTPHPGKHAKAKVVRPAGRVVKAKDSDAELEQELERIQNLITEMAAGLERAGERVDASLDSIDQTLQALASQRKRIQIRERELGIER